MLDDDEEREIVTELLHDDQRLTYKRVQMTIQQFLKRRRENWIKEKNEGALRSERKFKANDVPCSQWCEQFFARHPNLENLSNVRYLLVNFFHQNL